MNNNNNNNNNNKCKCTRIFNLSILKRKERKYKYLSHKIHKYES